MKFKPLIRLMALLLLGVAGTGMARAQKSLTINGYITDNGSGEQLIGASVYDAISGNGAVTNVYGFYSLSPGTDSVILLVGFVGYKTQKISMVLTQDTTINISLEEASELLKEIEIVADRPDKITKKSQMSTIDLSVDQIESLPVLLGETDILKTIQLLPGVQSGSEGTSGIYVRGGGPDQNLILLDGVPVYNASHLFGFFSVFNSDAISNVQLIKGGFPARYGGRLSSVLDIRMKEGNMKKVHGEGSIGLVAAKFTLEGPLVKDKTSFIVSGRRTYIDILAAPIIASASSGNGNEDFGAGYYFYDVNAKVNHKFSDRDRLFLSAYLGDDVGFARASGSYQEFGEKTEYSYDFGLNWGNITTALRWNRILSKKLFSNTTLTFSRYRFLIGQEGEWKTSQAGSGDLKYSLKYDSGIRDFAAKVDFDFVPNPRHYVRFGVGDIYHTFNPGVTAFETDVSAFSLDTTIGNRSIFAHELSAYCEDDVSLNPRLKANVGLHFSGFLVSEASYFSLQPRLSINYSFKEDWSVKGSFATMTQFIHLLSNSTIGLPTDLWLPSTKEVKPQQSIQAAVGLARDIKEGEFQVSLEGFYKTMDNLIEYQDGATYVGNNKGWEEKIEVGRGWSYGAELFLQKKKGRFTGWIGYTLSWSERNFQNLNFGKTFPYRYDRRHDIGLALTYKPSKKIDFGVVWVYGTGNAISLATSTYTAYQPDGAMFSGVNEIDFVKDRNGYRMNAYHRLDVGVNFHKEKAWGQRTWSVGLYNAYNRRNPFFLYPGSRKNKPALIQVSIFPIIPSVTYSFKF